MRSEWRYGNTTVEVGAKQNMRFLIQLVHFDWQGVNLVNFLLKIIEINVHVKFDGVYFNFNKYWSLSAIVVDYPLLSLWLWELVTFIISFYLLTTHGTFFISTHKNSHCHFLKFRIRFFVNAWTSFFSRFNS